MSETTHDEALTAEYLLEREDALERSREGLLNFTRYTFPTYEINWHHQLIARTLNRFARGEIPRLMIFTPPRHGKSELVSRRLPAFMLGRNPDLQVMLASYAATLANKMNLEVQRIITSSAYKQLFPATTISEKGIEPLVSGTWLRNRETVEIVGRRGYLRSAGIGGAFTGEGADVGFIDDPTKNWSEALSQAYRDRAWDWYMSVFETRLSKNGVILMTATRWHEDDLPGRVLARSQADPEAEQWEVLSLPALREAEAHVEDPRKEGEALWPQRYPLKQLQKRKAGSLRVFNSLYQQRPSPPEGNLVPRDAWRFYRRVELPVSGQWHVSADLNLKKRDDSDWTVYLEWLHSAPNVYITRRVRRRMGFLEQKSSFAAFVTGQVHRIGAKWIEDAANAQGLIAELGKVIPGLIPVVVTDSKLQRAEAAVPYISAGNVFLPHPDDEPWVVDFIEEWANFPNGTHDDQVDATSLGILEIMGGADDYGALPSEINKESHFYSLGV